MENEVKTESTEIQTVEPTSITSSTSETKVVGGTPFWRSWKFILSILGFVLFLLLIWGIVHVFTVYKNSERYKKAYDVLQVELDECDKIEGTSQPKSKFDYCDEVKVKFKEVERN